MATPRASRATVASIVVVEFFALGSLAVPLMLGLAMAVNRIETTWEPEAALSLIAALGAASALVANPVFGAWCDRRRHRGAGRAGFMLGGVVAGVAAVALLLAADSIPELTAVWMLAQASFNATFAALYGMIADLVHETDRGRVSGLFGAAAVGSVVVGMGLVAVLPKVLPAVLLPMPILALPITLLAYRHLRRLPRSPAAEAKLSWWQQVGALRGNRQYWLVWWQRVLVQATYGVVTGYGLYFLIRRVGLAEESAATWVSVTAALSAAASSAAAILFGRWAGRRGSYGPFIVASLMLIGVALGLKAVGTTATAYAAATVLVGIGIGCYYAVDLALVLRTVPASRAGLFLGFFNIARTLPQSLVPAVAPLLLMLGDGDLVGDGSQNYFAFYAFGFLLLLLSAAPLRRMAVLRRSEELR